MKFSMNAICAALTTVALVAPLSAQGSAQPRPDGSSAPASATLPANYLIGPQDLLAVVIWREKDMSAEVVVRPDGKISLPLLNDIDAAGLSPETLRLKIAKAATKFIKDLEESNVTVVVKEIKSRNVYVTGQVAKAGAYSLGNDMTVLQAISVAGGLLEYADDSNIVVLRKENGKDRTFKFNYKDVIKGKGLEQNIVLLPNDTIIVP
jgi:polysaccharide export outer membrane protein